MAMLGEYHWKYVRYLCSRHLCFYMSADLFSTWNKLDSRVCIPYQTLCKWLYLPVICKTSCIHLILLSMKKKFHGIFSIMNPLIFVLNTFRLKSCMPNPMIRAIQGVWKKRNLFIFNISKMVKSNFMSF